MQRTFAITVCAFALPGAALAATRSYDVGVFEGVAVASGVAVDINRGPTRSVLAETKSSNFDDLKITVKDNVLRIERPASNWFSSWFGARPDYQVHVVTPSLHSLIASSGSEVTVKGGLEGDFSVTASSGSDVDVAGFKGGKVTAQTSSGSELAIAGSCISLKAEASSGSDLDADDLQCENVSVQASSGSDLSVAPRKASRARCRAVRTCGSRASQRP